MSCGAMWCKIDQRNQDREEADDMEHENHGLYFRQLACEIRVYEERNEGHSVEYQGSVPSLEIV